MEPSNGWCTVENVADVNDWDDAAKSKFLKVRLVGKAKRAFKHLAEATCGNSPFACKQKNFNEKLN